MADMQNVHAVGRRKEAVCRVYLNPGSGKWDVNGRTLGDYFPRPALVSAIQQPFTATDTLEAGSSRCSQAVPVQQALIAVITHAPGVLSGCRGNPVGQDDEGCRGSNQLRNQDHG
jgi:hypothetical protein